MNNEEQGLQTRMAAHARAQAQAGSGNLGAVKRALRALFRSIILAGAPGN